MRHRIRVRGERVEEINLERLASALLEAARAQAQQTENDTTTPDQELLRGA